MDVDDMTADELRVVLKWLSRRAPELDLIAKNGGAGKNSLFEETLWGWRAHYARPVLQHWLDVIALQLVVLQREE